MSISKKEYLEMLFKAADDGTFPSYNRNQGTCEYRNLIGSHRCAVGILMSEEDFKNFRFSNIGAAAELPYQLIEKILPKGLELEDLENVQETHDYYASRCWNSDKFKKDILELECFQEFKV